MQAAGRWLVALALVVAGMGCAEEDDAGGPVELCYTPTVATSLCDPATATFTLDSTNPYYPLTPGLEVVLEGVDAEEDEMIRVERRVTADTRTVMGVETHILEHREFIDGELDEVALNFYVEASDGTVCYFGEEVSFYEGGAVANHDGSWRAGVDGAMPGVIMPAAPAVGQRYLQEDARASEALDMGRVVEVGGTATFAGTAYTDVLTIHDTNPFDDCEDEEVKRYVPGVGEVQDADAVLVSVRMPGAQ